MAISDDLIAAKRSVSGRLLRAGLRGGVTASRPSAHVATAVAKAGHNVHAVGVGHKVVTGEATSTPCVRIYVVQKLAAQLLPPRDRLPERIDGVPTDVIESAPAFALTKTATRKRPQGKRKSAKPLQQTNCSDDRQQRQRPIVPGISVAHEDVTAGTLTCLCRSTAPGDDPDDVFALSNNHVFADTNNGLIGDDLLQPGPADGGSIIDRFATLHRYVDIIDDGITANRVDAAIGRLLPEVDVDQAICTIGRIDGTARGEIGLAVRKHGRTTGLTEGVVSDEALDVLVGLDPFDPRAVALFEDQMRIDVTAGFPAFGLGGDSGSLVAMRAEPRAVGLFFAGPPGGLYGIANQMDDVENELEIAVA